MAVHKPSIHGRDHVPPKYGTTSDRGGDPIKGMLYLPSDAETDNQVLTRDSTSTHGIKWADAASGGGYVATPNKFQVMGPELEPYMQMSGSIINSFAFYTADSTATFGGYARGNADGSFMCIGMPLGPRYSGWIVNVWYLRGPDCGIFNIEWATSSIDEYGSSWLTGSAYSVQPPPTDDDANWYTVGGATSLYQTDAYRASNLWDYVRKSQMVIVGADGTMLSSGGATPSTSGMDWTGTSAKAFDAGGDPSVYWWMRIKVRGKNASSSNYRCYIAGVSVVRYMGAGFSVT